MINLQKFMYPVDTGRKLNVHKAFRRRSGRLLNVLCAFNLRPGSTGYMNVSLEEVITKNYYVFDDHAQDICKKVIKIFSALAWTTLYLILFWNIITAHWFGSFTASRKMKNVCNLCKMRNCHVMRNSWKKMFLTRETFKVLI